MVISVKAKKLVKNLAIPLVVGGVTGFLTKNDVAEFMATAQKPVFMPPGWLFPVVWTILYALMGIAAYIVDTSPKADNTKAFVFYYAQLFFNFIWSFIFFSSGNFLLAFLWILILLALIIITTVKFYKIEPKAAYLMIPYIIWVAFATVLNFSIYILNM